MKVSENVNIEERFRKVEDLVQIQENFRKDELFDENKTVVIDIEGTLVTQVEVPTLF